MSGNESQLEPRLERRLGFWALTAYGVGDILGAGIYVLVGKIAGIVGDRTWIAFAVAMGVASLTALSYAELGARFPSSGGEAAFCRQAFRWPTASFMVGWLVLASGVVSLATVARAFAGYVLDSLPALAASASWIVPAVFLLVVAGIAFWGIRQSSAANIVCTIVEVIGLLIVVVTGLVFLFRAREPLLTPAVPPGELAGANWILIGQGSALAFFAFIGFEDMVNVAEEVKRPERNLPRAILTALAVAGSVYILVAWVATSVVPADELARTDAPLLEVVRRSAPWLPASLFTLIALFAVANTGLLNFVMGSRLLYGMSRQELLPAWLGAVHARTHTPHFAIVTVFVVALVLTFSGSLEHLAGTTSTLLLTVFFTVNLSLVVLKRRGPARDGVGFQIPLCIPLAAAVTCLVLVLFAPPESLLLTGVVILIGWIMSMLRDPA